MQKVRNSGCPLVIGGVAFKSGVDSYSNADLEKAAAVTIRVGGADVELLKHYAQTGQLTPVRDDEPLTASAPAPEETDDNDDERDEGFGLEAPIPNPGPAQQAATPTVGESTASADQSKNETAPVQTDAPSSAAPAAPGAQAPEAATVADAPGKPAAQSRLSRRSRG